MHPPTPAVQTISIRGRQSTAEARSSPPPQRGTGSAAPHWSSTRRAPLPRRYWLVMTGCRASLDGRRRDDTPTSHGARYRRPFAERLWSGGGGGSAGHSQLMQPTVQKRRPARNVRKPQFEGSAVFLPCISSQTSVDASHGAANSRRQASDTREWAKRQPMTLSLLDFITMIMLQDASTRVMITFCTDYPRKKGRKLLQHVHVSSTRVSWPAINVTTAQRARRGPLRRQLSEKQTLVECHILRCPMHGSLAGNQHTQLSNILS